VTEDLIEYHWLSDPNPRVFQLGVPGSLASQYVVVKFGAPVVKMASAGAHFQVIVQR
jgi:predicted cobalt transporter CbtA